MHHYAGFHFTAMVVFMFKVKFLVDSLIPIAAAQKHLWKLQTQFTNHRSKIIATMAIQNNKFEDLLSVKNGNDIAQHRQLSAWIHIDVELYIELAGVYTKWNNRKYRKFD